MSGDETEKMATMDRWLDEVCRELDVDRSVLDAGTVSMLRLIKDVAHGPSRPGAPMTAFLVGLAAGSAVGAQAQAAAVADGIAGVDRALTRWDAPAPNP
ncbi:DUF6457 domain-containing protein [Pengzhenrongella sicca]|uniref:Molybdopterin-guanine dinucleotide biosynthesis protein MobA n=1 Tax=Pengzhenrongella sicca TaxID=2819238 RepID=A0A8A4ZDK5_9MICO|nr:DUF6457 domain-containing protein [Pengzhenrongella sicca]QTE29491.1 molybdopterin-guanine dinucleotide biosynthesis protein MobA [Pengzhenrongella sicca]